MELHLNNSQTTDSRERVVSGSFAVGAAEVVGVQVPPAGVAGFIVTKVVGKPGRYQLKFYKTFKRLKSIGANFIGPDDTDPAGTAGESGGPLFRVNTISTTGTILFQARQVSGASAAITSGVVVMIDAVFSDQ